MLLITEGRGKVTEHMISVTPPVYLEQRNHSLIQTGGYCEDFQMLRIRKAERWILTSESIGPWPYFQGMAKCPDFSSFFRDGDGDRCKAKLMAVLHEDLHNSDLFSLCCFLGITQSPVDAVLTALHTSRCQNKRGKYGFTREALRGMQTRARRAGAQGKVLLKQAWGLHSAVRSAGNHHNYCFQG